MSHVTLEPLESEFGSKTAVEQTENKRAPLTIRAIGEILDMTFDDRDLVLANGYLALGERTAVRGMGGVGKSRLVMQLALCCRAGRFFAGKRSGPNWDGYSPNREFVAG
jgi:hypothetical protein